MSSQWEASEILSETVGSDEPARRPRKKMPPAESIAEPPSQPAEPPSKLAEPPTRAASPDLPSEATAPDVTSLASPLASPLTVPAVAAAAAPPAVEVAPLDDDEPAPPRPETDDPPAAAKKRRKKKRLGAPKLNAGTKGWRARTPCAGVATPSVPPPVGPITNALYKQPVVKFGGASKSTPNLRKPDKLWEHWDVRPGAAS